jgi:hypothetical protein
LFARNESIPFSAENGKQGIYGVSYEVDPGHITDFAGRHGWWGLKIKNVVDVKCLAIPVALLCFI